MTISIRKATLDDLPTILPLWKKQTDYHHELDPTYYQTYNSKEETTYLTDALKKQKPLIFLAFDKNQIIGLVTFQIDKPSYEDTNFAVFGEILELYVEKNTVVRVLANNV